MTRHPPRSPSFSNDIFRPRAAWLRNNRIRESHLYWHRAEPKEIPEYGYFLIVPKHEGNMPFENDGLRVGE